MELRLTDTLKTELKWEVFEALTSYVGKETTPEVLAEVYRETVRATSQVLQRRFGGLSPSQVRSVADFISREMIKLYLRPVEKKEKK